MPDTFTGREGNPHTEATTIEPTSLVADTDTSTQDDPQETDWNKVKADLRARYKEGTGGSEWDAETAIETTEEVLSDDQGTSPNDALRDANDERPAIKTAAQRAKELLEAKRFEQDARREAKRRERAEKEAAEVRAQLEALKANPFEALKHAGIGDGTLKSYGELTQGLVDGRFNAPTPEEARFAQLTKELEELKGWKTSREEAEIKAREEAEVQEEITHIKTISDELADDYPLVGTVGDWVWSQIRDDFYAAQERGEPTDLHAIMKRYDDHAREVVAPILRSDRALKALVSDPDVKAALLKVLGVQVTPQQKRLIETPVTRSDATGRAAPGNGPRTLTGSVKADMPNRTEVDEEDSTVLRQRAREAFNAWQQGMKGSA